MSAPQPADTKLVIGSFLKFALWRPPESLAERIRHRWPQMRVLLLASPDALPAELPDANIFVGYTLKPDQLAIATRLQWMHIISAGVAQIMTPQIRDTMRDSGIMVTNSSGVNAVPMAEHTVGMMLAMARDFPGAVRYQMQSRWAQQEIWAGPARPRELAEQVAVIVGFGAVGRAVAERLRAFGMRVWAVTHSGKADAMLAERVFPATELGAALPDADYLVLAAPETPGTLHMIAAPQLAKMKPSAILVNVARGSLVDEAALMDALRRRAIAAAALDVTAVEPLPPESPLWQLENVFITPHLGGVSDRIWERQCDLLLENLELWFAGKPLRNRVDFARGY
jgi:phosphoglycerate dehydrogenase-like enzyme